MVVLVHDTHPTIHDPPMNYANMLFYEEINRDIKGSEKKNKRDTFENCCFLF